METVENVNITVDDAVMIANMIDACAKRAAFEASEFEVIGGLRTRIVNSIANADPDRVRSEPEEEEVNED